MCVCVCVCVCDLDTSTIRQPGPDFGCSATEKGKPYRKLKNHIRNILYSVSLSSGHFILVYVIGCPQILAFQFCSFVSVVPILASPANRGNY